MNGSSAAGKRQTFHVATLGATKAQNAFLGKDIERKRINSLLVNHDERLSVSTNASLEINDLLASLIQPLALRLNQLFSFIRIGIKESTGHFRLFVFKSDIARHDMALIQNLRHIRMTTTVIQDNAIDKTTVGSQLAFHGNDFHTVQINGRVGFRHAGYGTHDRLRQGGSQIRVEFGLERGAGHVAEQIGIGQGVFLGDGKVLEKFQGGVAGNFQTIDQDARVQAFAGVAFCLTEQFTA
mmetsp:Transcript_21367/g.35343  ORF Transcript_21367/g.35343 Transcript_21367/m.35343 type:complete len:239 (+) Transcript_21367:714-1430(+)